MAKKILLIDDNRLTREINGSLLEQAGYKTVTAGDGRQGLKKLEEEKIDLILLDLIMPGIDGFEFLKLCKENPLTRDIPVVVLTIRDSPQDIERAKRSGAEACLIKHKMRPAALLDSVRIILGE
jgi:CheY-like chemotaxis protein